MELVKIEEGIVDGEVLYHQFIQKTEEEKKIIRQRRETRRYDEWTEIFLLKIWSFSRVPNFTFDIIMNLRKNDEKVRKIQEAQRKKKEEVKEQHREKSMEGMKRKQDKEALGKFAENEEEAAEDDDAEYYRSEVGQEPEKGMKF